MEISPKCLVEIFVDLVNISATAKQEKPVADYIRTFLEKLDIRTCEDKTGELIGGNTGNIIATIGNHQNGVPDFALVSHMDTVKPTAGIRPQINNDRITTDGRTILGADNRAGIALILSLVEHLYQEKIKHHPFEVIFTVGEETGLYGSTNLDLDIVKSRVAYILDSSADPGYFVYAAPGAIDFHIDFEGKGSHAAVNPEQGINAIKMAADLIQGVQLGKVDENTTINFGKIHGGEANNVVPPYVNLTGEIRSFYRENIDNYYATFEKQLEDVRQKYSGKCFIKRQEAFPGFILDQKSEPIRRLSNSLKAVGLAPYPIKYYGGSDANVLNNRGITAIDLGIGAKNPHSVDEYIKISDMVSIGRLIRHLVTG